MTTKILGISGSIRAESFNKKLINAVGQIVSENGGEFETYDIGTLPLFNEDLESNVPEAVVAFKNKIKMADAVIIAAPEYNRSVPGVLKNAIDWASRPYGDNSFDRKVVGIIGATPGTMGTAVSQNHLKQVMVYLNADLIGQPEVYVSGVSEKFDTDGNLQDSKTKEVLEKHFQTVVSRIKGN